MLRNPAATTGLLLAATLLAAAAAAALPEFEASFELRRDSLRIGTTTLSLSRDDNGQYRYESRTRPSSWTAWVLRDRRHESSRGHLDATGIRPLEYHYERRSGGRERTARLLFDWEGMRVENQVDGSRWGMHIPAGTLDKLASQLGMILALQRGESDITFKIADGGRLKEYRFRVLGKQTLEVPAGTFATVKLTRQRENSQYETHIWCAPALDYFPVRIRQRAADGTEYQSDLESVSESLRVDN
ncbi:MAG: DUF3108 domain-containing protein [Gammaproteobacteria bacterium]